LIARWQRARSDDTHLSPHDVDQLRQLVQKGAPQKPAEARHARVVLQLEQTSLFAQLPLQLILQVLSVPQHRPEFKERKRRTVLPVPFLQKQNRRTVKQQNQNGDHAKQRAQNRKRQQCRTALEHATPRLCTDGGREHETPFQLAALARTTASAAHKKRQTGGRHCGLSPFSDRRVNERKNVPRRRVPRIFECVRHPYLSTLSLFHVLASSP